MSAHAAAEHGSEKKVNTKVHVVMGIIGLVVFAIFCYLVRITFFDGSPNESGDTTPQEVVTYNVTSDLQSWNGTKTYIVPANGAYYDFSGIKVGVSSIGAVKVTSNVAIATLDGEHFLEGAPDNIMGKSKVWLIQPIDKTKTNSVTFKIR